MASPRIKSALIAGAGSIGRRHLSNLKKLGLTELAACDPHPDRLEYVAAEFQARCFPDLETGLDKFAPDAVLICTPPVHHVAQSLQALEADAHVFVEKPLSDRIECVEELQKQAEKSGKIVQVGYNLRFHPPIEKLKQLVDAEEVGRILWARVELGSYLPDWRPWQDYRKSYTARRELGGGIVLDGSHEIDYVTWLFGAPQELVCMAGHVSPLDVNVEDCATILLRFPGGTQADIHLDFIQRSYSRNCALIGTEGKLQWDLKSNEIELTSPGGESKKFAFDCEINEMYVAEMRHFLECAENDRAPRFGLKDAILTLRIALSARRSAEEKMWVTLD